MRLAPSSPLSRGGSSRPMPFRRLASLDRGRLADIIVCKVHAATEPLSEKEDHRFIGRYSGSNSIVAAAGLLEHVRPSPFDKGDLEESTATVSTAPTLRVQQASSWARGIMRDEYQDRGIFLDLPAAMPASSSGSQAFAYSAVFDGHGGTSASSYAVQRLQEILQDDAELSKALAICHNPCGALETIEALEGLLPALLHSAFSRLDEEILRLSREAGRVDGATAVAGLHSGAYLFVANAGDSRAVLCRGGEAVRMTQDHKPEVDIEMARIQAQGGQVQLRRGVWRVMLPLGGGKIKMCATCRGLGDRDFKDARLLTSEPDVTCVVLRPHVDAFSVFASDGLWGFVNDQTVIDEASKVLQEFAAMSSPDMRVAGEAAARRLVKLAQDRGGEDDVTVVVNVYDWGVMV